jgi:hypothetical protein
VHVLYKSDKEERKRKKKMLRRRVELLKPTALIRHDIKIEAVKEFIVDIFKTIRVQPYFMSAELTMIIYNFLLNSIKSMEMTTAHVYIFQIMEKMFACELTTVQKEKIVRDLEFIVQNNMQVKISELYYYTYNAFLFFFQVNS